MIDIPALDQVRAWRNLQAAEPAIAAIEAQERRLQVRAKVLKALKWSRLFGGSALLLGVDQGRPDTPIDLERLGAGSLAYLHVVSRHELSVGVLDRDPASPGFGAPTTYSLVGADGGRIDLHPSRVIRLGGVETPDLDRTDGWGDPVLLALDEAIKNAGLTAAGIAGLVQEAKVDVFKIKDLTLNVGNPDYRGRMLERFELANLGKSINNALIMDADEAWEQKTVNFAQLPEVMRLYLQIAAGAADIPATRFLGQSPDGLNATGEGDLRNYYDRISAEQELTLRPALEQLDAVLVRSALGQMPDDYYWTFAPLWQLGEKDRAEIFKLKVEAVKALAEGGLVPAPALAEAVVNTLIEDGMLPGLEAAMGKHERTSHPGRPASVEGQELR